MFKVFQQAQGVDVDELTRLCRALAVVAPRCLAVHTSSGKAPKPLLVERCPAVEQPSDFDPSSLAAVNHVFQQSPRLIHAVANQHRATLKALLAKGENPNICVFDASLLTFGVGLGDGGVVTALLDGGAP